MFLWLKQALQDGRATGTCQGSRSVIKWSQQQQQQDEQLVNFCFDDLSWNDCRFFFSACGSFVLKLCIESELLNLTNFFNTTIGLDLKANESKTWHEEPHFRSFFLQVGIIRPTIKWKDFHFPAAVISSTGNGEDLSSFSVHFGCCVEVVRDTGCFLDVSLCNERTWFSFGSEIGRIFNVPRNWYWIWFIRPFGAELVITGN